MYQRYETAPGEQMQYDWSDYTVVIGGKLVKVHVHSTILGHSRYRVYSASLKVKQSDVFEALELQDDIQTKYTGELFYIFS